MARRDHEEARLVTIAVTRHLSELVRPVIISGPSGSIEVGSGQVLRVGDHHLLVTAGHNVAEYGLRTREIVFDVGLTTGNEINLAEVQWLDKDRHLRSWITSLSATNPETGEQRSVKVDAAIVELSEEEVARFGIKEFGLDNVLQGNIGENFHTVVLGYPSATYDKSRAAEGIVKATFLSFGTVGAPASMWREDWLPGIHQVVRYPGTETARWDSSGAVVRARLPPPEGISGCALWAMTWREGKMFNPVLDSSFAGIQYGYLGEVLVGCDATLILSMIAHAFPDTVPLLRERGFRFFDGALVRVP